MCGLTKQRYRHLLYYTVGPGMLAGLLSDREDIRMNCLRYARAAWDGWKAAAPVRIDACTSAKEKAWLRRPLIVSIMTQLDATGFKRVPPEVSDVLSQMFSCISTKHIEDAFQRLRVQEQRGQSNMRVRNDRAWSCLITQQILSTLHGFDEISFRDAGLKRALEGGKRIGKSVCSPGSMKSVMPLHKVASAQSKVCVSKKGRCGVGRAGRPRADAFLRF